MAENETELIENPKSPYWNPTTKLVIGLTLITIAGAFLVRFQNLIGPMIVTFMIVYLLHPVAVFIANRTQLSWRGSVNLIFIVLLLLIVFSFTATSLAIVNQLQSLIGNIQAIITDLPEFLDELLTTEKIYIIPIINYEINTLEIFQNMNIDLLALTEQALGVVQPALGQAGGLLGSVAAGAATFVGWGVFILSIAYFILADAGQVPDLLKNIDLPGHMGDFRRLGRDLGRIWNAFLRGQILIFLLISIVFLVMLSVLGVRNALGLALLAGLSKFVPYIGPFIARTAAMLVAFFQDGNYFDLEPWIYALVVVLISSFVDQIFDSIVIPRIFGQTLGVHPAAVLIAALVAASLLGFIGLILAAPALATFQMLTRYILRKMVDLDPWPGPEPGPVEIEWPFEDQIRRLWQRAKTTLNKRIEDVKERRRNSNQDPE